MMTSQAQKEGIIVEQVYLYDNNNFPCFVQNGETVEDPNQALNENEQKRRIARNGLRNITYGTPFRTCNLATWSNFKFLFFKKDPALLQALRKEMQTLFLNVYDCVKLNRLDEDAQERLEIFINNLLSAYPFTDPRSNETLLLPQKINNKWELVKYHFKKIDMSPQTGLLSKLIEDEDRFYAYGLVPVTNRNAQPYLAFIGTTYPSGQGAKLNWLYNLKPNQSVGEGHDWTVLEKWISRHENIKVVGHSKGATMGMIAAAQYPNKVSSAFCLSPTALCQATLDRLNPQWENIPVEERPVINVYAHRGDPVFLLENSFLDSTHIFRFGKKTESVSMLEAHIHYFAGRKSTDITEVTDIQQEIPSKSREFVTSLKEILNWILFPTLYTKIVYELSTRKIKRFYDEHAAVFEILLFGGALGVCILLCSTGILAPVVGAMLPVFGTLGTGAILTLTSVAASAVTAGMVPKAAHLAESVASKSIFSALSAAAIASTATIGSFFSLAKIGFNSLFCKPETHQKKNLVKPTALKKESTPFLISLLKSLQSELPISQREPADHPLFKTWNNEMNLPKLFNKSEPNQPEEKKELEDNRSVSRLD